MRIYHKCKRKWQWRLTVSSSGRIPCYTNRSGTHTVVGHCYKLPHFQVPMYHPADLQYGKGKWHKALWQWLITSCSLSGEGGVWSSSLLRSSILSSSWVNCLTPAMYWKSSWWVGSEVKLKKERTGTHVLQVYVKQWAILTHSGQGEVQDLDSEVWGNVFKWVGTNKNTHNLKKTIIPSTFIFHILCYLVSQQLLYSSI